MIIFSSEFFKRKTINGDGYYLQRFLYWNFVLPSFQADFTVIRGFNSKNKQNWQILFF